MHSLRLCPASCAPSCAADGVDDHETEAAARQDRARLTENLELLLRVVRPRIHHVVENLYQLLQLKVGRCFCLAGPLAFGASAIHCIGSALRPSLGPGPRRAPSEAGSPRAAPGGRCPPYPRTSKTARQGSPARPAHTPRRHSRATRQDHLMKGRQLVSPGASDSKPLAPPLLG